MRPIPRGFGLGIGLVVLLVLLVCGFTPVPEQLARALAVVPRIEAAHAIVVLGGGVVDKQTLSLTSLRRTIHGMRLYRRELAPILVFSGGMAGQDVSEGVLMAQLAVELGVPNDAVWVESQSNDTWTEASEVARLVRPHGVHRILLVTDPLHMRRAIRAFERAGFEVLPAGWELSVGGNPKPEMRLTLMREVGQEALAQLYYWARTKR